MVDTYSSIRLSSPVSPVVGSACKILTPLNLTIFLSSLTQVGSLCLSIMRVLQTPKRHRRLAAERRKSSPSLEM
ncbi:hypothetical protein GY45DRAFT_1331576 [Cubamyces sp. BRFM 1775]|nr:hypothetical protein GY45DRAFT_1331576 [Cubamyces sp. BRFM 1775]